MRGIRCLGLAVLALAAAGAPAFAFQVPEPNAPYPTPHQQETRFADNKPHPWATTYGDEAARKLGVENGRWEAFQADPGARFNLKGGIDNRGAVLRLTW